jgi:1-pyrroline-5-carboxylate dehydrogenase
MMPCSYWWTTALLWSSEKEPEMSVSIADLPRVTYTNTGGDLSGIHNYFDTELPKYKTGLGRRFACRIGGTDYWDGELYDVRSPLDKRILLGTFLEPSDKTIAAAVTAAKEASKLWSHFTWQIRTKIMRDVAKAIARRKYEFAMAAVYEAGKTRIEAIGEAEEAVDLINYYCSQIEDRDGYVAPRVNSSNLETAQVRLRPFGTFAVIAPFNYPIALVANMAGAALVAGNSVVLKASPAAGLTASLFMEAVEEAGLPTGTVNLLFGHKAGQKLLDNNDIDGVAFTGSNQTGMSILRKFALGPFMRPVIGELGGKNYAYVTSSADLSAAVEGVAKSAFAFQGQKCSACSVVFVHSSVYEDFLTSLKDRAQQFKIGNTEDKSVHIGPLINKAAVIRYLDAVKHAEATGRLLYGGSILENNDLEFGNFVLPTIVADLPEDDLLHKTELFAPIVTVRKYDDLAAAIIEGNSTKFGLTAGIYSRDISEITFFENTVEAGVIYINRSTGATTGAWPGIQSFCGWKGSGLTGKGGLGPHYLPQFMREQCVTRREI